MNEMIAPEMMGIIYANRAGALGLQEIESRVRIYKLGKNQKSVEYWTRAYESCQRTLFARRWG